MLPHRCRVLALGHESLSSELLPSIIVSAETILAEKFIPIMPLLCRTLFVMIVQAYNLLGALQSAWLGRMAYLISSFVSRALVLDFFLVGGRAGAYYSYDVGSSYSDDFGDLCIFGIIPSAKKMIYDFMPVSYSLPLVVL